MSSLLHSEWKAKISSKSVFSVVLEPRRQKKLIVSDIDHTEQNFQSFQYFYIFCFDFRRFSRAIFPCVHGLQMVAPEQARPSE